MTAPRPSSTKAIAIVDIVLRPVDGRVTGADAWVVDGSTAGTGPPDCCPVVVGAAVVEAAVVGAAVVVAAVVGAAVVVGCVVVVTSSVVVVVSSGIDVVVSFDGWVVVDPPLSGSSSVVVGAHHESYSSHSGAEAPAHEGTIKKPVSASAPAIETRLEFMICLLLLSPPPRIVVMLISARTWQN
jgi:hypothetical protein